MFKKRITPTLYLRFRKLHKRSFRVTRTAHGFVVYTGYYHMEATCPSARTM